MKILYVTTVSCTMNFFKSFIGELVKGGHTVELACNCDEPVNDYYIQLGCKIHNIRFSRNPMSPVNLKAYKELLALIKQEKYDIVHCHTPVASVYTRLACIGERKKGTKVFYTAHGFHFYKGAPLLNWLVYYPAEKVCAYFTDVLITINKEDYALAQKKMKAKRVEYVPGVGIDVERFGNVAVDRKAKRSELGIPENAIALLSVGELNENKNHETVIRAIAETNMYYLIAGSGELYEHLQSVIVEYNLNDRVKLLGYRNDIGELCKASDIFVFPSFREGLSVSVMEAMACGLPVVCSRIRGNIDLIDENGGRGFDPHSIEECRKAIQELCSGELATFGAYNSERVKEYSFKSVKKMMHTVYFGD